MLFVLQMAFGVLGPNPINDLLYSVIAFLPQAFAAILIIVVGAAIAAAVREIVHASPGGLSYGNALANTASIAILAVAGFAALNQMEIAPAIVNGLFYAVLAVVAGSAIIAIGGGGVLPMWRKWEEALGRYVDEKAQGRPELGRTEGRTASARGGRRLARGHQRARVGASRAVRQQRAAGRRRPDRGQQPPPRRRRPRPSLILALTGPGGAGPACPARAARGRCR